MNIGMFFFVTSSNFEQIMDFAPGGDLGKKIKDQTPKGYGPNGISC